MITKILYDKIKYVLLLLNLYNIKSYIIYFLDRGGYPLLSKNPLEYANTNILCERC